MEETKMSIIYLNMFCVCTVHGIYALKLKTSTKRNHLSNVAKTSGIVTAKTNQFIQNNCVKY